MESVELLDRLVGFPTVSSASNLELIRFAGEFLIERGIEVQLIPNASGDKANLFATVGPRTLPGVILSGHTDVVPVDGQIWTSEPFRLVQRENRLVGRGAADMKGFVACALNAAARARYRTLAAPLHLALSFDEEIGCLGVRSMLDWLAEAPVKPRFCIVGEPTLMRIALGHKGKIVARATCFGFEGHSALSPRALNAIHLAVDFVDQLRTRQEEIRRTGATDPAYDVPFTTIHVGRIVGGGAALNIVPNLSTVDFEIRNIAEDNWIKLLDGIIGDARQLAAPYRPRFLSADIRVETINETPSLNTPRDGEIVDFVRSIAADRTVIKVPFGTEAGLFHARLHVPTVVCGPGSIDQAHRPDEFIERSQLDACDAMMDRLITRLEA